MSERYEDRYRSDASRGEWNRGRDERGFMDRAGDEVRTWFGDDEAERRRRFDEQERQRDRQREEIHGRDYGWRSSGGGRDWDGRNQAYTRGQTGASDRGWFGDHEPYRAEQGSPWGRYGSERHQSAFGEHGQGSGQRFAGKGPKGYQRADARITEDVCDRLSDSWDVDASEIEVTVSNGEVTLSGTVQDREQKRRAEDLVEALSGVREVNNQLRVTRTQNSIGGESTASTSAGRGSSANRAVPTV